MDNPTSSGFPVVLVLAVPGFVALVVYLVILSNRAAERKRQALSAFAQRHGFVYNDGNIQSHDTGLLAAIMDSLGTDPIEGRMMALFEGFSPFGNGHSRRVSDLVYGPKGDRCYYFFNYQYTVGSGKNQTTYHYGITGARVPLAFSRLEIRPETFLDRIGGVLGLKDIQFEMEEFNRAYYVRAADEKAAFDIIHPGMIEFLLAIPKRHWQFTGFMIVVAESGSNQPEVLEGMMNEIDALLERIPAYVKEDIGFTPTWRSPLN